MTAEERATALFGRRDECDHAVWDAFVEGAKWAGPREVNEEKLYAVTEANYWEWIKANLGESYLQHKMLTQFENEQCRDAMVSGYRLAMRMNAMASLKSLWPKTYEFRDMILELWQLCEDDGGRMCAALILELETRLLGGEK